MNVEFFQLLASVVSQPAVQSLEVSYFLKDFNTPFWHWLFRGLAGLGLTAAVLVYLYYRRDSGR